MGTQIINSNFSNGELSPLLESRVDFQGYYKGARSLKNTLVLPQGGATRRFGLSFVDDYSNTDSSKRLLYIIKIDSDIFVFLFKDLAVDIYYQDVITATIATPYSEDIVRELSISQDGASLVIAHKTQKVHELIRQTTPSGWLLVQKEFKNNPTYDFNRDYDNMSFTPDKVSGTKASPITLTAALGEPFTVHHIGGLFLGNEGTMRITEYDSNDRVKGYSIEDFKNANTIEGQDAYLSEPVFGSVKGYPKEVNFYQNRMTVASTNDLPGLIALSATDDPYNFDDSQATASDAISQILTSDRTDSIKYILHSQNLFLFTDSGEFSTPPFTDKPASPSTTYFIQQTKNGTIDVRPQLMDNRVIFIDKGGKIVRAMAYDVQRSSYQAVNISILSPHLIKTPIDAATFENPSVNDGTYLIVINDEGDIAILQTIETENINAWTPQETDGKFKQVASVDDSVYFLIERTVNEHSSPETRLYLEKIDFDVYTDSTRQFTFGTPQSVISGLSWLNDKEVWVTADGYIVGKKLIHNNTITLDEPATTVSIGLGSRARIIPMPINFQGQTGNNRYTKKRIKTVYVDYYESLGIKINDHLIPGLKFSESAFGDPLVPKTGVYEYDNMGGWEREEEVVITQDVPLPFTIRSISYEVET